MPKKSRVDKFYELLDMYYTYVEDDFFEGEREYTMGDVTVRLREIPILKDTVYIALIRCFDMGKGKGSNILDWLIWAADKAGVTLTLIAQRTVLLAKDKRAALTTPQLIAWYGKRGFEHDKNEGVFNCLIRYPKRK